MPCGHSDSRTNGVGIPRMGKLGQGARTQQLHMGLKANRVSKWRDSVKWETNQELSFVHRFQISEFSGAVSFEFMLQMPLRSSRASSSVFSQQAFYYAINLLLCFLV